jgi:sugar/nucleoside kinase (ribokinase family)
MKKELLHFIENSDIIIMNREEVEGLTGIKNMNLAMKRLNKLNAETVVVTLGSKGAVAFDGKKFYKDRGFNPRVVDPTGCGDSFTSGFLHCILKGKDIPRALNFANANAALEILDIGQHGLSESSVLKFISKH